MPAVVIPFNSPEEYIRLVVQRIVVKNEAFNISNIKSIILINNYIQFDTSDNRILALSLDDEVKIKIYKDLVCSESTNFRDIFNMRITAPENIIINHKGIILFTDENILAVSLTVLNRKINWIKTLKGSYRFKQFDETIEII